MDRASDPPYTRSEYYRKALWFLVQATVFRVAPGRWRARLVRWFGGDIAPTAKLRRSVKIHHPWLLRVGEESSLGDNVHVYNLGPVEIGPHSAVSQNVHLCAGTHDWKLRHLPLERSSIVIGSGVWVCADAFIGPGVTVGHNSIVGARAVVMKDVPERSIVAGNPAVVVRDRPMTPRDEAGSSANPKPAQRTGATA